MKTKSIISAFTLLCILFLGSCSQDQSEKEPVKEYPVTFTVSALNVDTEPFGRSGESQTAALSDVITEFRYYILDNSNDKCLKRGSSVYDPQDTQNTFGVIKESLSAGSYRVLVYGIGKGAGNCSFTIGYDNYYSIDSYFDYIDKEVFTCKQSVNIEPTNRNYELNLTRRSGMLKIDITDNILPEVAKVVYTFGDYRQWYPANDTYKNFYSIDKTAIIQDQKVQPYEYYFSFPKQKVQPDNRDLTISVYDSTDKLIGERKIQIPIYINKRTIVSGDLFKNLQNMDISITVDDKWNGDINIPIE